MSWSRALGDSGDRRGLHVLDAIERPDPIGDVVEQRPGIAAHHNGDQILWPGGGTHERDLDLPGQRIGHGQELPGRDGQPQHRLRPETQCRGVDLDVEPHNPTAPQLLEPPSHRRLRPVQAPCQTREVRPAIAGQLG